MAKVIWASSGFNGEGSSEKCPATTGNRLGGKGPTGIGKGALCGGVFVLGPRLGDNMTNSLDNHISPPHMVWIWEARIIETVELLEAYWAPV